MGRRRSSGGSQIEGVVSSIMEAESSGLELSADMANINVEWMKERKKEQGLVNWFSFDNYDSFSEVLHTLIRMGIGAGIHLMTQKRLKLLLKNRWRILWRRKKRIRMHWTMKELAMFWRQWNTQQLIYSTLIVKNKQTCIKLTLIVMLGGMGCRIIEYTVPTVVCGNIILTEVCLKGVRNKKLLRIQCLGVWWFNEHWYSLSKLKDPSKFKYLNINHAFFINNEFFKTFGILFFLHCHIFCMRTLIVLFSKFVVVTNPELMYKAPPTIFIFQRTHSRVYALLTSR